MLSVTCFCYDTVGTRSGVSSIRPAAFAFQLSRLESTIMKVNQVNQVNRVNNKVDKVVNISVYREISVKILLVNLKILVSV